MKAIMKKRIPLQITTAAVCAVLLSGAYVAPAQAAEETAHRCTVTDGSFISWVPVSNLLKSRYATNKTFTGAVQEVGTSVYQSDYTLQYELDAAGTEIVISPDGKLESGQLATKASTFSILYSLPRKEARQITVGNPFLTVQDTETFTAGVVSAQWEEANTGATAVAAVSEIVNGKFDFTVDDARTTATLSPHDDEIRGPLPPKWIVEQSNPGYDALTAAFPDYRVGRNFPRLSSTLNLSCTPFQRPVVTTPSVPITISSPPNPDEVTYCTIGDNSVFGWGVKRSWRSYLDSFAAGKMTVSDNIDNRIAQVQPDANGGYSDRRLKANQQWLQSRYQLLFPIDKDNSFVTLKANGEVVDMRVRTLDNWTRFKSEDHKFDNAVLNPEAYISGSELRVAATPDVDMTLQNSGKKIKRVGNHDDFVYGAFTQSISPDYKVLTIGHDITGVNNNKQILSTAKYSENSSSNLIFAGTYTAGEAMDPALLELNLNCRPITASDPKPAISPVAPATPIDRAYLDATAVTAEATTVIAEASDPAACTVKPYVQVKPVTGISYMVTVDGQDLAASASDANIYEYDYGQTVTVKAVPAPGYKLTPGTQGSWSWSAPQYRTLNCAKATAVHPNNHSTAATKPATKREELATTGTDNTPLSMLALGTLGLIAACSIIAIKKRRS